MSLASSFTPDPAFPCSLIIRLPFPSHRLADAACQALSVDQELSALVQRSFTVVDSTTDGAAVLQTIYRATTNRMLRVAVNGFLDQVGTVIQVMEELDVDVLHDASWDKDLEGVQGVEVGMTGSTITGG